MHGVGSVNISSCQPCDPFGNRSFRKYKVVFQFIPYVFYLLLIIIRIVIIDLFYIDKT